MVGTVCDTCTSNGYHCPISEFFCLFSVFFFPRWCRLHKNVSAVGLKSLKILNFGHSSLEVSNIGRESRHIGTTLERAITYIPLDNNFTQINCRYEYLNLNILPATYTTPKAIYYAWREILKSSTAHRVGYPGE